MKCPNCEKEMVIYMDTPLCPTCDWEIIYELRYDRDYRKERE